MTDTGPEAGGLPLEGIRILEFTDMLMGPAVGASVVAIMGGMFGAIGIPAAIEAVVYLMAQVVAVVPR